MDEVAPDQREAGSPILSEIREGVGRPREEIQRPIVVDQGLAGAGDVEELDGGAPVVAHFGGVLGVGGGPVAQSAVGLHQLVVIPPDPGHPLGGGAVGGDEAGAPVVGRVVELVDVVEHRPARGDGVGFSINSVWSNVFER